MNRETYPSDVSDDKWAFVVSHLTLMCEDTPQRKHSLREVFSALRYIEPLRQVRLVVGPLTGLRRF